MAKERTFKAVSKQFIKYDGKFIKIGEDFKVKESDVEELKAYADIEVPEETVPPIDPGAGQNGGEPGGNGGQ